MKGFAQFSLLQITRAAYGFKAMATKCESRPGDRVNLQEEGSAGG